MTNQNFYAQILSKGGRKTRERAFLRSLVREKSGQKKVKHGRLTFFSLFSPLRGAFARPPHFKICIKVHNILKIHAKKSKSFRFAFSIFC